MRVLQGDCASLEDALAAHEQDLAQRIGDLQETAAKVHRLRTALCTDGRGGIGDLADLMTPPAPVVASFALPWPWGGETFDVAQPRALNFLIGPLASGKTQLAGRLAEVLPDTVFLGLERLADGSAAAHARLAA